MRYGKIVSVPLRGYGFEMFFREHLKSLSGNVSVPLRGYGFEMFLKGVVPHGEQHCFRPLVGIWF